MGEGWGEGLPGNQPTTDPAPSGPRLFTLSKGRGRFGRLRPKPVRGLPRNQARVTQGSPEGEGWDERSSGQPSHHGSSSFGAAALHPLQGERQVRASSAETGEGSSAQPAPCHPQRPVRSHSSLLAAHSSPAPEGSSGQGLHPSKPIRTQSTTGRVVLHPLRGERQVRASSAETGEGSSAQPAPCHPQRPVRSHSSLLAAHSSPAPEGSSGQGLHPSKPIRTQSTTGRVVLHPLRGERQVRASSAETGEGSSAQPAPCHPQRPVRSHYSLLSAHSSPSAEGLPGNQPLSLRRGLRRASRRALPRAAGAGSLCSEGGATAKITPPPAGQTGPTRIPRQGSGWTHSPAEWTHLGQIGGKSGHIWPETGHIWLESEHIRAKN